MPRLRRTATRSVEPQSPARQRAVASNQPSPEALPSVLKILQTSAKGRRDDRRKAAKPQETARKVVRPMGPVAEEEDEPATDEVVLSRPDNEASADGPEDVASSLDVPTNLSTAPSLLDDDDEDDDDDDDDDDEQLAELDRDLITETLPALFQDASKLLSFFELNNVSKSLHDIETTKSRLFKLFDSRFSDTLTSFRHDQDLIRPQLIFRKLAGPSWAAEGAWRPDAVLYLANLAILVSDVVVRGNDTKLEMLANSFPEKYFLGSFREPDDNRHSLGTTMLDHTMDVAIAIRTQFFVRVVDRYVGTESFDPDSLLHQAFFDEDHNLLGLNGPQDARAETMHARSLERINEIRKFFATSSKNSVKQSKLRAAFPWSDFVHDLTFWALLRSKELEAQITKYGGVEQITQRIRSEDFTPFKHESRRLDVAARPLAAADAGDSNRLSRESMNKRLTRYKQIQQQKDAEEIEESSDTTSHADRNPTREIRESPVLGAAAGETEGYDPISAQNDEELEDSEGLRGTTPPRGTQVSTVPTQETALLLQASRRQVAQSNKENVDTRAKATNQADKVASKRKFIDRQEGATRVRWNEGSDDDDDDFETDKRTPKRTRLDTSYFDLPDDGGAGDQDNQDDEEEEIQRRVQRARDRTPRHQTTSRAQSSSQPGPSRSPLQVRMQNDIAQSSQLPASTAPSRARRQPSSDSSVEALPPSTQFKRINRKAQANVRVFKATSTGSMDARGRKFWTETEIDRLVEFLAEFRGSRRWTDMLEEDRRHPDGPALQDRTNVDLKDKARNMKMDLLKALRPLPDGFAEVSIKKSDKEALNRLGIPTD